MSGGNSVITGNDGGAAFTAQRAIMELPPFTLWRSHASHVLPLVCCITIACASAANVSRE